MNGLESVVFKDKKFSDILEEIYSNQKQKQKQLTSLISELKPLITDIGDATMIVPLIKEYMEISVKNDEQLIKMATIIQRIFQTNSSNPGSEMNISEEEKAQLLAELDKINSNK
jgi:predicted ATP-grasp superfamily ATP-dependent carboligase